MKIGLESSADAVTPDHDFICLLVDVHVDLGLFGEAEEVGNGLKGIFDDDEVVADLDLAEDGDP